MNALPSIVPARRRSCVYMLTDGARVKIGTTTDLRKRVRALSGACGIRLEVLRVIDHAGEKVERWLHRRFDEARTHGEWFNYCPEMLTVQPPEEACGIPVVVHRRDVRLTLKERIGRSDALADEIGLGAKERLLTLLSGLDDAEAAELLGLLRSMAGSQQGPSA